MDTNILIAGDEPSDGAISIVTLVELEAGLCGPLGAKELQERRDLYDSVRRTYKPIPLDEKVLGAVGLVEHAVLSIQRKTRTRRIDLLIAATAITEGLPLLTHNVDDFRGLEALLDVRTP